MCQLLDDADGEALRPEYALAQLMNEQMQVSGPLNPVALKLFLQAHWPRVTKLAHKIHDEHQEKK